MLEKKFDGKLAYNKSKSPTEGLEYAIQMARWLLRPLGLWPIKSSNYPVILHYLSISICSFLLAFRAIPNILYMIYVEMSIKKRLKLIGPLSFSLMNVCKYIGVLIQHRKLQACITAIARDYETASTYSEQAALRSSASSARVLTGICALFMYCGGLPYTIALPLVRNSMIVGNKTTRHFAYPGYYVFFDPQARPNYEIVYSLHCLCGIVTYTVTCALCGFAILCVMHICGQIAVTGLRLESLQKDFEPRGLGNVVRTHIRSLRFVARLENILNGMCFVEVLGCTFNMCMLGYYFITEFENSETFGGIVFVLLLISFTFNIFVFCYIGDLLTERCNSLGKVVYMIDWQEFPAKNAKGLILIMAMTYQPTVLTAGKLFTLSLNTFVNVLKISVSYLNILRTLIANAN